MSLFLKLILIISLANLSSSLLANIMSPTIHYLKPTKHVPNSIYPLLIYRNVFSSPSKHDFQELFIKHGWDPQWTYGMFFKSHYHTVTHECLGVYKGSATLRFGVADSEDSSLGVQEEVKAGDVIIIPAGVAHRALEDRDGFTMVGSYPKGSEHWDMGYEDKPVKEGLGIPEDPIGGNLKEVWGKAEQKKTTEL